MHTRPLFVALAAAIIPAAASSAAVSTINYGWEDGSGTTLAPNYFIQSGTNVAEGTELDYGPSDAPFTEPVPYDVTPFEGSRMLQATVQVNLNSGGSAYTSGAYLGFVNNLDEGDTVTFSFRGFDPTDGRSPSILPEIFYAEGDPGSFGGYASNQIDFPTGSGWIEVSNSVTIGDRTYDATTDTGVVVQATVYPPSLANGVDDDLYNFFIDDLVVTVTTDNPDASLTLPDGSVVSLVPEPTTAALLGLGGLTLLRRRRA